MGGGGLRAPLPAGGGGGGGLQPSTPHPQGTFQQLGPTGGGGVGQGCIRTAVHRRRRWGTPPPRPPPLPMLEADSFASDLSFKIFGPPSAETIGGPWEEGGPSQPPPPFQTPPPTHPLPPFEYIPRGGGSHTTHVPLWTPPPPLQRVVGEASRRGL